MSCALAALDLPGAHVIASLCRLPACCPVVLECCARCAKVPEQFSWTRSRKPHPILSRCRALCGVPCFGDCDQRTGQFIGGEPITADGDHQLAKLLHFCLPFRFSHPLLSASRQPGAKTLILIKSRNCQCSSCFVPCSQEGEMRTGEDEKLAGDQRYPQQRAALSAVLNRLPAHAWVRLQHLSPDGWKVRSLASFGVACVDKPRYGVSH
ncbi:hypothetical protein MJ8_46890 [Mesorhizobium sp. J8]|nr:hypothetical protein MJ8_46890 [Mesorhizobium sp. J8]